MPNTACPAAILPARSHPSDSVLSLGVELPQVRFTAAALGCKLPAEWGMEVGMNEAGVVVGWCRRYLRVPPPPEPAGGCAARPDPEPTSTPPAGPNPRKPAVTRANPRQPRLRGPELVRLALERGGTAEDALHCCCRLLEVHGQARDRSPPAQSVPVRPPSTPPRRAPRRATRRRA